MRDNIRAGFKLFFIVVWLLLMYAALWVASIVKKSTWRDHLIRICNQGLLVIIGVKLTVSGELVSSRPLLLVTNHLSYLDVILIAACAHVRFTPKSDIGRWFFIGSFCRLCGAIFIDRKPEQVAQMKQVLHNSLVAGDVVCLFPEATTGNGIELKDFKSGFFNLAKEDFGERSLLIQPAAVIYTHIGGLPIDREQWASVAWYGDMELTPHLWQLLMLPAISAEMVFLPAIPAQAAANRKQLAVQCRLAVAEAIETVRQRPKTLAAPKLKVFNPSSLRKK